MPGCLGFAANSAGTPLFHSGAVSGCTGKRVPGSCGAGARAVAGHYIRGARKSTDKLHKAAQMFSEMSRPEKALLRDVRRDVLRDVQV